MHIRRPVAALVTALALAGPVFRLILGLLQLLLALTIVLTTILSLTHPDQPSESAVQNATGIAGSESIDSLIKSVTLTPWGFVAVALGIVASRLVDRFHWLGLQELAAAVAGPNIALNQPILFAVPIECVFHVVVIAQPIAFHHV